MFSILFVIHTFAFLSIDTAYLSSVRCVPTADEFLLVLHNGRLGTLTVISISRKKDGGGVGDGGDAGAVVDGGDRRAAV